MKFAEVILPLPVVASSWSYAIPEDMQPLVQLHVRVIVPFGAKHQYIAIVTAINDYTPASAGEDSSAPDFEYKEIIAVLDKSPVILPRQLNFWEWIASYYLCKTGDVYKAAMPPGLIRHETGRRFAPKKETYIRLASAYCDEDKLHEALNTLKRARQQEQMLLCFLEMTQHVRPELLPETVKTNAKNFILPDLSRLDMSTTTEVSKKELLKASGLSATLLDGLVKRGILESYEKEVSRIQQVSESDSPATAITTLTETQQNALDGIRKTFKVKPVCLLHGVSMSGKTEIYIRLIRETLQQGSHVLYLLPEIAVTGLLRERWIRLFGNQLLMYHSGLSDNERVEIWQRLMHAREPMVVVGVRSAMFLPFTRLGLVIVDDEHDLSYRQQDPAPRYHARNAAIMLSHMYGAKTLLGSATPSLESYFHAGTGKYGYVALKTRYGDTQAPQILVADVKDLRRRKIMKNPLFSPVLKEKMEEALQRDEKIVLFLNRRGFAVIMECASCGHVMRCVNCDVSLTFHKQLNKLVCHCCGHTVALPSQCPACRAKEMKPAGFGTEKVEEEIRSLFPNTPTARLDTDTAATRGAYEHILKGFEQGKTKILIGTQMIAKGLDFAQVSVVGILNVDSLMNVPDFRAYERAFQLITQVSSLIGRNVSQGTVVIQTSRPEHPLIQAVKTFDYKRIAIDQLQERNLFRYPPYYRLIVIVLRCGNEQLLEELSTRYAAVLHKDLGERVTPPFTPPVNRMQALYVRHIALKIETSMPIATVHAAIENTTGQLRHSTGWSKIMLHFEVDN
ncbi:MAG: primosomal protein N' [Tannerella sp.]|nr:primosomal protein N' [Tannerella sp.]